MVHYNGTNVIYQPFQKVIKVGNSLAVILPKALALGLEIQRGDLVLLTATAADKVIVRLLTPAEIAAILKNNPSLENEAIEY